MIRAPGTGVDALVLDSSVALAWVFPDEVSSYADTVLDQLPSTTAIVTGIWHLEVVNALLVAERRGRISQAQLTQIIEVIHDLPVIVDRETPTRATQATLSLARTYNLSAYDASYLELAMCRGLPLATLDERLRTAANAVGILVYAPPSPEA